MINTFSDIFENVRQREIIKSQVCQLFEKLKSLKVNTIVKIPSNKTVTGLINMVKV